MSLWVPCGAWLLRSLLGYHYLFGLVNSAFDFPVSSFWGSLGLLGLLALLSSLWGSNGSFRALGVLSGLSLGLSWRSCQHVLRRMLSSVYVIANPRLFATNARPPTTSFQACSVPARSVRASSAQRLATAELTCSLLASTPTGLHLVALCPHLGVDHARETTILCHPLSLAAQAERDNAPRRALKNSQVSNAQTWRGRCALKARKP